MSAKIPMRDLLQFDSQTNRKLTEFFRRASLSEIHEFTDLLQEQSGAVKQRFTPNLYCKTWREFGTRTRIFEKISSRKVFYWIAATCLCDPTSIRSHETLRNAFEIQFFNGNFETAGDLLDEHERILGKSLWGHKWRSALYRALNLEIQRSEYERKTLIEADDTIAASFIRLSAYLSETNTPTRILRRAIREHFKRFTELGVIDFLSLVVLDELPSEIDEPRIIQLAGTLDLLPLPDRHTCFIRLATHLLSGDSPVIKELTRSLQLSASISYDAKIVIAKQYSGAVESKLEPSSFKALEFWDLYFCGRYYDCNSRIAEHLEEAPPDLSLIDLKVKSQLYLGQWNGERTGPSEWLEKTLTIVLRDNDISDQIYDELDHFATSNPFQTLSSQIGSFIASYSGNGVSKGQNHTAELRSHAFSPRRNEDHISVEQWRIQLNHLHEVQPRSLSVRFLLDCLTKSDLNQYIDSLPLVRRLYFSGLASLKLGDLSDALEKITNFIDTCRNDLVHGAAGFAIGQATILQSEIYRRMGDAATSQKIVVDLRISRSSALKRLNLSEYYRLSHRNRRRVSSSIDFPILAALARVGPHEICLSLKRFLVSQNVKLPSELCTNTSSFSEDRILELLHNVCVVENLDSISILDSNDKVDEERLKILRWISKNYPLIAKEVEAEKITLIQVSQLREGLERIDDNKLVLDLASLQEVESRVLEEIHQDLRSRVNLAFSSFTEKIQRVLSEATQLTIVSAEEVDAAYNEALHSAFDRIRRVFIRSPQFGLEACLSGRIRHGIVVEHILSPLKRHSLLITDARRKSTANFEFSEVFSGVQLSQEQNIIVFECLTLLTDSVALEARAFRDTIIQTSLEPDEVNAAFNYYFPSNEILTDFDYESLMQSDWKSLSFSVFAVLAERTRECLPKLRDYIQVCFRPSILQHFDYASSQLDLLPPSSGVRSAILRGKQDMEEACENLLRWFQELTGAIGQDVSMSFVMNTALGMLERLHPEFRGAYSISCDANRQLNGRFFNSFVHIIFFLIENGVKHTDVGNSDFGGIISFTESDSVYTLIVTSIMKTQEGAEQAALRANARIRAVGETLNPDEVIRERGSGFAKIVAALRYEFKSTDYLLVAESDGSKLSLVLSTTLVGVLE